MERIIQIRLSVQFQRGDDERLTLWRPFAVDT